MIGYSLREMTWQFVLQFVCEANPLHIRQMFRITWNDMLKNMYDEILSIDDTRQY